MDNEIKKSSSNFIRDIIDEDMKDNIFGGNVVTRFPPEPNGCIHIGHAKSICLNYGIAHDYKGKFNLRFDDTNPCKEEVEYIDAIKEDLKWLGADWEENLYFASDYFDTLYEFAVTLIKKGKAYICDLTADQIREYRGTLTEPGRESPYRKREVKENLEIFQQMKDGKFPEGSKVLRAKIDMSSGNINMRDPVMYRIMFAEHPRTGDKWCIYPTYDFTHGQSDSIEGITHSLCSLEFEDHRPLYDWFIENLNIHHPKQIEFARLNLTYTVMSKRKLREIVEKKYVRGWNDPRMPTIAGLRRRGFTPQSIRDFLERIGIAKRDSTVDIVLLEHCLREELNKKCKRVMAVLRPLKIIIDNYPEGKTEYIEAIDNPEDPDSSKHEIPFSKIIYIEKEDFREDPPKKYFRLSPGREVRLKHAYYIKCNEVVKDQSTGEIIEIHCSYDPETRGGGSADGRKIKGTLHWVSAEHAIDAEVRQYNHLFNSIVPGEKTGNIFDDINPDSFTILKKCKIEPSLKSAKIASIYQFLRQGYYCVDLDSSENKLVFNRSVSLKDSWAKIVKKS